MICNILVTEDDGQAVAGSLRIDGDSISCEANKGYEDVMSNIEDYICFDENGEEVKKEDGEKWLSLLPRNITGSYLKAQLADSVDEEIETTDCHNSSTDATSVMEKHSHAEVHYEAQGKNPLTICGRCVHFIPKENGRPACEVVSNPIHFNGWCEEFTENDATFETSFQGLPIFIENRTGSVRKGKTWTRRMSNDYGYIKGTLGVDGDHVDCFIGSDSDALFAYVVHALNHKTGGYDEDKVMLGFSTAKDAHDAFLANYGFDERFFGSMDKMPMALFVKKLDEKYGAVIE